MIRLEELDQEALGILLDEYNKMLPDFFIEFDIRRKKELTDKKFETDSNDEDVLHLIVEAVLASNYEFAKDLTNDDFMILNSIAHEFVDVQQVYEKETDEFSFSYFLPKHLQDSGMVFYKQQMLNASKQSNEGYQQETSIFKQDIDYASMEEICVAGRRLVYNVEEDLRNRQKKLCRYLCAQREVTDIIKHVNEYEAILQLLRHGNYQIGSDVVDLYEISSFFSEKGVAYNYFNDYSDENGVFYRCIRLLDINSIENAFILFCRFWVEPSFENAEPLFSMLSDLFANVFGARDNNYKLLGYEHLQKHPEQTMQKVLTAFSCLSEVYQKEHDKIQRSVQEKIAKQKQIYGIDQNREEFLAERIRNRMIIESIEEWNRGETMLDTVIAAAYFDKMSSDDLKKRSIARTKRYEKELEQIALEDTIMELCKAIDLMKLYCMSCELLATFLEQNGEETSFLNEYQIMLVHNKRIHDMMLGALFISPESYERSQAGKSKLSSLLAVRELRYAIELAGKQSLDSCMRIKKQWIRQLHGNQVESERIELCMKLLIQTMKKRVLKDYYSQWYDILHEFEKKLGLYAEFIEKDCLCTLATAEFLYREYIQNRIEIDDYDYSCISLCYFEALEQLVNTGFYQGYRKILLEHRYEILDWYQEEEHEVQTGAGYLTRDHVHDFIRYNGSDVIVKKHCRLHTIKDLFEEMLHSDNTMLLQYTLDTFGIHEIPERKVKRILSQLMRLSEARTTVVLEDNLISYETVSQHRDNLFKLASDDSISGVFFDIISMYNKDRSESNE